MSKKDKVLAAYQQFVNRIEDLTEYRVDRPSWLQEALDGLHEELKRIAKFKSDPNEDKPYNQPWFAPRETDIPEFGGKKPAQKCFWDSLSPEDRNKPMGISCPCPKCTPYSMTDAVGVQPEAGLGKVTLSIPALQHGKFEKGDACKDEGCPHYGVAIDCQPHEGGCVATVIAPKSCKDCPEWRGQKTCCQD